MSRTTPDPIERCKLLEQQVADQVHTQLGELETWYENGTGKALAWEFLPPDQHSPEWLAYAGIGVGSKTAMKSVAGEVATMLDDGQLLGMTYGTSTSNPYETVEGRLGDDAMVQVVVHVVKPRTLADCDDPEVFAVLADRRVPHTEAARFASENGWPASEAAVRRWRDKKVV